ncbi:MAG: hypothetical protein HY678_02935 [Chloroflexi bacterium]|nr:hypothetical protein [Chloroflexota bacterium]
MSGSAGASTVSITPADEIASWGGTNLRRDPQGDSDLLAHAVAFSDGAESGVLVSLDLTMVDRSAVLLIREACAMRTGIPADHITIAANHVHLAPPAAPGWAFLKVAPDPMYMDFLRSRVAEAVQAAQEAMRPARIAAGAAPTTGITFNRRYLRPDGGIKMVFAADRDPALPPAGPTDSDLSYLLFEQPDGKPIALVTTFSAHNHVTGGSPVPGRPRPQYFHRDFGGRFGDVFRRRSGLPVPTAYFAGPCGDTAWQDPGVPPPVDGGAAAWRIGEQLADAFFTHVKGRARRDIGRLRFANALLEIPDRPLSESRFCDDACRGVDAETRQLDTVRWPAEEKAIRARGNTACHVEIGAISIGDDIALSTNPAELFVEFGLDIKRRSPFPLTMVVELANGHCGYVPTERAFKQGGYETHRSVYVSRLAKNAGRIIADKSVEILRKCGG